MRSSSPLSAWRRSASASMTLFNSLVHACCKKTLSFSTSWSHAGSCQVTVSAILLLLASQCSPENNCLKMSILRGQNGMARSLVVGLAHDQQNAHQTQKQCGVLPATPYYLAVVDVLRKVMWKRNSVTSDACVKRPWQVTFAYPCT